MLNIKTAPLNFKLRCCIFIIIRKLSHCHQSESNVSFKGDFMNSKHIFLSTLVGPLVIPSLNAAGNQQTQHTICSFLTTSLTPHASAYGSPIAKTPVFDFVARNGWLFNNAFVTSRSSPSRASILTGLYPGK